MSVNGRDGMHEECHEADEVKLRDAGYNRYWAACLEGIVDEDERPQNNDSHEH